MAAILIDTCINELLFDSARANKTKKYCTSEVTSAYTCFELPQSRYIVHVCGNEIKNIVDFKTTKVKTNSKLCDEFQKEASHLKSGHFIFEVGYYSLTGRFIIFDLIIKNDEILKNKTYSDRLKQLELLNIYGEYLTSFTPNITAIDRNATVAWVVRELGGIYEYIVDYIIDAPEPPNQNYPVIGQGKLTIMTKVAFSKTPYKTLSEVPILDTIKETLKKESLIATFDDGEEISDSDLLEVINGNLSTLKTSVKAEKVPTVINVRLIATTAGKIFAYVPISESANHNIEFDTVSKIPQYHNENDRLLINDYVPYQNAHIASFKYSKTPYRTSLLKLSFVKWFSIVEFGADGTITVPFPIGTIPYLTQNKQLNNISRFSTSIILTEAMRRIQNVKHTDYADSKCKIFANNLSDMIDFFNNIDSLKRKKQDEEPVAGPQLKKRKIISDSEDESE